MKIRSVLFALMALTLGGCATYDYDDDRDYGDRYYGTPATAGVYVERYNVYPVPRYYEQPRYYYERRPQQRYYYPQPRRDDHRRYDNYRPAPPPPPGQGFHRPQPRPDWGRPGGQGRPPHHDGRPPRHEGRPPRNEGRPSNHGGGISRPGSPSTNLRFSR